MGADQSTDWSYCDDAVSNETLNTTLATGSYPGYGLMDAGYISLGSLVVLLLVWWFVHKAASRATSQSVGLATRGSVSMRRRESKYETSENFNSLIEEGDNNIKQTGYKESTLGRWIFYVLLFVIFYANLLTHVFWIDDTITVDFFFPDHVTRQILYLVWWHISLVLVVILRVCFDQVRNFFRIECPLDEATHVLIWEPAEDLGDFSSTGWIRDALIWIENMSKRVRPKRGTYHTKVVGGVDQPTFEHHLHRYVYSHEQSRYVNYNFQVGSQMKDFAALQGLDMEAVSKRLEKSGPNSITIPIPTILTAIRDEFFQFFYIYQYFLLNVFFNSYYVKVGSMFLCIVLISGGIQVYLKRKSQQQVAAMVVNRPSVICKRENKWRYIRSHDLVPGDLVGVDNGMIPCDLVLIQGSAVVDESMLTGESMPVAKAPVESTSNKIYDPVHGKKHTLYCGTLVLGSDETTEDITIGSEAKTPDVVAVVNKTGVNTSKGDLISGILNPSQIRFKFDEHLQIVMMILSVYAVAVFFCTMIQMGLVGTADGWFYGMYRVVTVIPILLPTVFVVAASRGAKQLKDVDIFCTNPSRIMMAGKVRVWCFDKTGTLTRPGLDFVGAQPVIEAKESSFGKVSDNASSWPDVLQVATATAHELTESNGRFVGNSVDLKMFAGSGWNLGPGPQGKPAANSENADTIAAMEHDNNWVHKDGKQMCVLKRFQFDHARMTMSSVVLEHKTGRTMVFVKGAYERISGLCSNAVPADYEAVTQALARSGNYVLGMSFKELEPGVDVGNLDRDELESGLTCVGLIIFRNVPKEDTKEAIEGLRAGQVRPVMITGDNELTGVHIAKECSLISSDIPDTSILTGRLNNSQQVEWVDETGKSQELPEITASSKLELAMTGEAFRHLKAQDKFTPDVLNCCRVFARMKPQDKVDCVYLFMKLGIVGMCGDGGNDCGALRAAHVGVALSDAEASIVSPFSSKNPSIHSVLDVLRFGRATLASSFATYKCMILWGQLCTTLALFKNHFFISMVEINWIVVDAALCIALSSALTLSMPSDKLSDRRPTISLLGASTLASCLGLIFINFCFILLTFILLTGQDWYVAFDASLYQAYMWWELADNYEAAMMFLLMLSQINNTAAVFNFGDVFRKAWCYNWVLILVWASFNVLTFVLVLMPNNSFVCMFKVNCGCTYFEPAWRSTVVLLIVLNAVAVVLWERFVILGPVADYFRNQKPRSRYIRL